MAECPFCAEALPETVKTADEAVLQGCSKCLNPMVVVWEHGRLAARPLERAQDIRLVAPEGSIGGEILAALPRTIEKLPVLPEISQRVLAMTGNPDASMQDLANVIREDQVIALAVMKLANSPVYGGLQKIADLSAACARLGMKTIANTVQAVANGNLYITGDRRLRGFMQQVRRHAVAAAHCAAELAALLAEPRSETLFLAGLIHDVGIVALLDIVSSTYSGAVGELRHSPELLQETISSFSPLIGLHVVQHWNMPPEFRATTYCRPAPAQAPSESLLNMTHIIALADIIAQVEGYYIYPPEETFLTSHPSARHLNLTDVKIAALRVDLADKLEVLLDAVDVAA